MICLMSLLFPFYDLRLYHSNLVLTPFYQSVGICLTDTSISPGLAILPLRECLRMVRHLYTRPLNFISRLLDFTPPVKVFPNSSRARECNCLYYATHTRKQERKFHSFLCAYIVKVTACSRGDFQPACISKRKTQLHSFNLKPDRGRTQIYNKRDKDSDIIFFNFFLIFLLTLYITGYYFI